MTLYPSDVVVSAPGKVLLAGGYLVLDRSHSGVVLGLSARISVAATGIPTGPGIHLSEVVVESPQFPDAIWRYGYHMTDHNGGIKVTQLQAGPGRGMVPNPFVETTLAYALSYVTCRARLAPKKCMPPMRLVVLADNDYYSHPDNDGENHCDDGGGGRFARFPTPIGQTNKTGLGSSAALVTSLTAAVLAHYLTVSTMFDVESDCGRRVLHNLAQAAHCAAQGKVGSGFDVAAAVYGSCIYTRFSPDILSSLPAVGEPGFASLLARLVDGEDNGDDDDDSSNNNNNNQTPDIPFLKWDTHIVPRGVQLPPGVTLRMCDVDCGSQTVEMVKKVLTWRDANPTDAAALWADLQVRNDELAAALRDSRLSDLENAIARVRTLVRAMADASAVPIEPPSQTRLLDSLSALDGVFGGVVPGAGGFDALALLMRDDAETERRVGDFLAQWKWGADEPGLGAVRLLGVRGEIEGVKREGLDVFASWL